jgi:FkbM family methyltransferase
MPALLRTSKTVRTVASYVPSRSLLGVRRLADGWNRFRRTPHETDFHAFSGLRVREPVVADVGANRGQSIDSFRYVLEAPRIHAFEPNTALAIYLGAAGTAEAIHNVALGERDESLTLLVPRYGHTEWDTRATLQREVAEDFLSPEYFAWFREGRATIVEYTIDVRTLDSFGLAPDILKIDAEGAATNVVRGGRRTIRDHRPILLVEDADDDVAAELADLGYRAARFDLKDGSLHLGERGNPNTFFIVDDHIDMLATPVVG